METSNRQALMEALKEASLGKQIKADVFMSDYTTLKVGGQAVLFLEINSAEQIATALKLANKHAVPLYLVGKGSNLLVRDGGIDGLVIHLGTQFADVSDPVPLPDGRFAITAQAGASLQKLSKKATDHALTGLEFAAGIPGSVGGAVYMNAGAYGGEMKDVISHVTACDSEGTTHSYDNEALAFGYRQSIFTKAQTPIAITSATVILQKGDEETIRATIREFAQRRRDKQPVTEPSCGSTFKRPTGYFAGTLIEEAGLKGYRIGGACVSEKHAGFLLNDQQGTASDFLSLMAHVQQTVHQKTGVELLPEVRIIGKDL